MKNFRFILAMALIGIILAGSAFAASPSKKTILVGTEGVYAPFTYVDDKGNLTGYDVEVVRAIAKKANLDVKFLPTPWDSMFLGLETKKFDVIANQISKNPEREKKYIFSDSYLISGAQIIVRGDRTGAINSLADLKGFKVGTGVGSNYTKILEDYNNAKKEFEIKYYDGNLTTVLQDIVAGRLDATLNERLTVGYNVKQLGLNVKLVGKPLALVPSHFVFRKDKAGQELKAKFDKALAELKKEGVLVKLSQEWFSADFTK
ncbi:L-cystine transport system substrate-binding protein [Hydrogenispora ethanolica]|jgi:ABC-type amino acid transport substrate-binding protein|uniref:L-cystine transport system substrate-binding protein n=1 Tax=Hydrogenispora ethanolica TaxID=1082276 RepID=A0A4R1RTN2_HYDET|nr:transporter substrate-binding domain-containing protein [Hydrogenispora ethanolica]TCL69905.1 L-cystine transport system substrate-binding protein [Hydrogenispora ethanolica]